MKMIENVEIIEVSPRDGIQNDPVLLSTEAKLALIGRARAAGLRSFEVTSFVNPKRVPQMADADAVVAGLPRDDGRYIGLTLNRRGYDRAVAAGLRDANFVVVASDTFNQRNQGVPTQRSIADFAEIRGQAASGLALGCTIGAAFGCPFEGEVPLARLMEVVEAVMAHAPDELSLADTIGVATPRDVTERVGAVRAAFPDVPLRLHLHNTRNTGIANAWAGLEAGVRRFDASLGGVGGCPFAPRATGNIATEDLVYMLDRAGIPTGVDLDAAIETAAWLEAQLGRTLPGMVMKAGGFPAGAA
ncbi:hydroxymethylglutaryl-CoA lyase [Roseisalinus antarcticus]|uniref:Hydroxymethylglutaryl-CoA lyase YngG n=1 Tax=Roseisalinus antarcticus TaxID=254357 RepID=A0A1Y5TSJ9_9RHOB|nr:hydroxymethylglutaryl-CoA lyase [Roseisalinus antarcticus]SLN67014.1 Hydroxymethylglutaryl-CoA lyase YngG [Roseisalinus antarcticus]